MRKDFKQWHDVKARIDALETLPLFREREIWWCYLGVNIGHEQDGGENFVRPVVVIKRYNLHACLIIPIIGRRKEGTYYFPLGQIRDRQTTALLSQLRFIDSRRLTKKIKKLSVPAFAALLKAIVRVNFDG